MVGIYPLAQVSQELSSGDLFFVLSILSGVILIYTLFRDVKINRREPTN